MAAQPSEFTLDSVRDFMVERGGRVTNHQLVKHFKYFLTEPHTKEYARLQFKEFVNTLATIQQQSAEEGGEKFLVLKAKFLPTPPQGSTMMQFQHHQPPPPPHHTNTNYMHQQQQQHPPPPPPHLAPMMPSATMRAPPPYRPPPEPRRSSTNSLSASPVSTANGFQFHHQPSPPPSYQQQQGHRLPPPPPPPSSNSSNSNLHHQQQQFAPLMNRQTSVASIGDFIPASVYLSASVQDLTSSSSSSSLAQFNGGSGAPVVPPRGRLRSSSHSNENNKENNSGSDMTASSSLGSLTSGGGSIDGGTGAVSLGGGGEVKISVKERTQRFNKMASEVDLLGIGVGGVGKGTSTDGGVGDHQQLHNNRHKAKAGGVGDEDDTSSVGTVEPRAREWMLATARGDYHAIARILRDEPRLARRRDFVTGYTGLHWAAKHGNDALVKMLAGTYKADVNARTNAGCSPLHIAALQGHDDVYDLLVKTYGADSNLRDYSGKKAYQYLKRADCTFSISSDTFRKITAKRNLAAEKEAAVAAGFLRIGSLNVRVKKTTEALNNLIGGGSVDNLYSGDGGSGFGTLQVKKKRPKDWPQPLISAPTLTFSSAQHYATQNSREVPMINAGESATDSLSMLSANDANKANATVTVDDSDDAYGFGNGWQ